VAERPGCEPLGVDEGVDVFTLKADDTAELVGGNETLVDEP
jgi:hypothetical protein